MSIAHWSAPWLARLPSFCFEQRVSGQRETHRKRKLNRWVQQELLNGVNNAMLHFPNGDLQFRRLRAPVAHICPQRIVNDDCATISECLDRMADIARHDPHYTRSSNLLDAVDGQFEFAFDNFVDFFLRMEMFMNGRTAFEVVMGERHASGVKVASVP